jgi:secreted PhoX family phosphatase
MLSRRHFLCSTGLAAFAAPLHALQARLVDGASSLRAVGYGPLAPALDATTGLALLELPAGFRYMTLGWTGDPMDNGRPLPGKHDGMAAFQARDGLVALVRNHEVLAPAPGAKTPAFGSRPYDAEAGGGTTTTLFDPTAERVVSVTPSLSGTLVNCAGGPTPWGSWLSCEETLLDPKRNPATTKPHGFIFEVPHDGVSTALPLTAMGRFWHEAIAIDPTTGIVYETEDRTAGGLYRFIPKKRGQLAEGGTLQALAIKGRPRFDSRVGQPRDAHYEVEWVDIPEPDRAHVDEAAWDTRGVFQQGLDRGAATFGRLEGASFGGGRLFVTATNSGDAKMGQVWEHDPERGTLRLVIESPGQDVLAMPDNIALSPRGGLALCEYGPTVPRVQGLTRDGQLLILARNNVVLNGERNGLRGDFRAFEFAGATYSPDGRWLFVNAQNPGVTFAITGPWGDGML